MRGLLRKRRSRHLAAIVAAGLAALAGAAYAVARGDRGPNVDRALATFEYERDKTNIRFCTGEDGGTYSSAELHFSGTIAGGHQGDPDSLTGELDIETHTLFQHAGDTANHGVTSGRVVIKDAVTGRAKAQGVIDGVLTQDAQGAPNQLEGLVRLRVTDDPATPGNSGGELVANFVSTNETPTFARGELGGSNDDRENPAVVAEGACGSAAP